jgi:DNA-binding XRE family transcriptional regulator/DNA-directed RNA polymerase subunit RPC12/RpoP
VILISDNEVKYNKEEMIDKLVDNLPALRVKLGMTQAALSDSLEIGRQTLMAIENKRNRMRWDTFLLAVLIFSKQAETSDYMRFLGLHSEFVEKLINDEVSSKKGGNILKFDKLWTDYESDYTEIHALYPLPLGHKGSMCPKCGSKEMTGARITPTADEQDPNILCKDCGYWRE